MRERVIVADEDAGWRKNIATWLSTFGYHLVGEVAEGAAALNLIRMRQVELAIVSAHLPGINGFEIASIASEDKLAPVIVVCSRFWEETLEKAKQTRVFGMLVKPFDETVLIPAVTIALTNYREIIGLEQKVWNLKTNLENRKAIERAKGLLMENLGISESEAFRRIQKLSMDKRLPMREIADAIILSHGVTGRIKKRR
ncbi:MAG: ANTAR domain-containing protein [Bacillota bacterium]